ncbi:MAG TPA: DsbA family protein [Bryobacteraceae bacterium]|nr:DsbA family protein [Bryobacteraceae bacterium]
MLRRTILTLAAALALALTISGQTTARKNAFDKAWLETYVRHLWVLDPDYKVAISDPKPSTDLPGLKEISIKVSQGEASQQMKLIVTADGSKIVEGSVYNAGGNPYKSTLEKLNTTFTPSLGTPGAPVVIVEFSDLECPHCKAENQLLREHLIQVFPTQVRLYFKFFPLTNIHPWAQEAAIAGRCVFGNNPGSFWNYTDWVFGQQDAITPQNLRDKVMEWAKGEKDVDALQLGRCIDDKATEKEVNDNAAEAAALEVDGTPTLFVNGRRVPASAAEDWPTLKRVIDNEIAYQETAKDAGENCGCETKLEAPGLPSKAPALASPLRKK